VPASIERAGNWLFLNGLTGDFDDVKAELKKAGSELSLVARLDQYYADFDQVAPYQAARKAAFAPHEVAPSTSVVMKNLKRKMELHVLAATAASGYRAERLSGGLNRPETSGYSPCLRMGDMVFMAGQLARDSAGKIAAHGVAEETAYIVRHRIAPALEASGSGLDLLLKAQAYASDPAEFSRCWPQFFTGEPPPTAVVPVVLPAFLSSEATVEINVIAAHASARSKIRKGAGMRGLDGLVFIHGAAALPVGSRAVRILDFGSVVDAWGYAA
jgi:enamine deaminase RidA (YjgF/YER057c/UK114 family)